MFKLFHIIVIVTYLMIKTFLILISLQIILYSSGQIILVVSKDFNTSKAYLECYEGDKKVFNTIEVNIGKNGLGWGLGTINFKQMNSDPIKVEGDKKAPAGVFKLTNIFGYKENENYKLPYIKTSNYICVDDRNSKSYNKIIKMPTEKPKSYELMSRIDHQYELGIVVEHNAKAIKGRGSCIFMHVKKTQDSSTAGCTAMNLDEIKKIASWLDEKKNPILIQIPESSYDYVSELYPQLKK